MADVDNDGNAEIVFASNNDANACSTGSNFPNGVAIWGDAGDAWVSARRVWNEHAYHVTNVLESGGVPVKEPESFKTYNGRRYNTYRSNPRSFGVAPDLTVKGVQVSSPDATCGQLSSKIDLTFEIANVGDLRVGPGVVVGFYGHWNNPALDEPLYQNIMMVPLQAVIMSSIEPGGSLLLQVSYDAANNAPGVLPDTVRVVVDDGDAQRECNEANNDLSKPVDAGMQLPDPEQFMAQYVSTNIANKDNKWQGRNITRWQSPECDKLYRESEAELDVAKRAAQFIKMNDLVCSDNYIIPVVYRPRVSAANSRLVAPLSGWSENLASLAHWYRDA